MDDVAMYALRNEPGAAVPPAVGRPPYQQKSIYKDCIEEENRHRWIESEKAGYDLGEAVVQRWVQEHWSGYLRAKWVEHLQGTCFWTELDRGDFGLLQTEFQDSRPLLDLILNRLKTGEENIHLMSYAIWTCNDNFPTERMIQILTSLDINSRRLLHRFEQQQSALTAPGDPNSFPPTN